MADTIEKEKRKKRERKRLLVVSAIIYVYLSLVYFYMMSSMEKDVRLRLSDALNDSMIGIFLNPAGIFPVSGESILYWFFGTAAIAIMVAMAQTTKALRKHDNPDTVNGEAHLMNTKELDEYNRRFVAPFGNPETNGANNMIISEDISLAIDNQKTRRNCNILAIGGSGAGKSRFFAGPNILQHNSNFVITDPSGEMLNDYAKDLEDHGYKVKVFNISDVYKSNHYNPFHYIRTEKDVFILVNTLIKNTTPKEKGSGDPFWENSEKLLIGALILYIWHVFPRENQNFAQVMHLLSLAEVDENDASQKSSLDILFEDLEREDPKNLAVKQYKKFKVGAGKTLKSILISVNVRLESFSLSDIEYLTAYDDLELENFSDTKQALFVIIPTADDTFNFIVSLLYCQLFSVQYDYAENTSKYGWMVKKKDGENIAVFHANDTLSSKKAKERAKALIKEINEGVKVRKNKTKNIFEVVTKKKGSVIGWRGTKEQIRQFLKKLKELKIEKCGRFCPNHIRMILDEFANIGQIPTFNEKLATIRKYNISCSIIIQALSQLKEIYKEAWNTIVANCDTKLFLGCDDTETIEWMLKMLGKKTTIVENTSYQAGGTGGSVSYNHSSLELLTIDQISMMQDSECLVRIRGVRPYYGKKYELTKHPNYKYAMDTAGTFYVPLSGSEEERDKRPLWERKMEEEIEDIQKEKAEEIIPVSKKEGGKKLHKACEKKKTAQAKKEKETNGTEDIIIDLEEGLEEALNMETGNHGKQSQEEIQKTVTEKAEEVISLELLTDEELVYGSMEY